jgi:hypothetical protein
MNMKKIMTVFVIAIWVVAGFSGCSLLSRLGISSDYDMEKIVDDVMFAIKRKDISALEAMMCKDIKENIKDLPNELDHFMGCMNGEITNISWDSADSGEEIEHGLIEVGYAGVDIFFQTETESYDLYIKYMYRNKNNPKEIGLRRILLEPGETSKNMTTYFDLESPSDLAEASQDDPQDIIDAEIEMGLRSTSSATTAPNDIPSTSESIANTKIEETKAND